jgi:hypothetical protein
MPRIGWIWLAMGIVCAAALLATAFITWQHLAVLILLAPLAWWVVLAYVFETAIDNAGGASPRPADPVVRPARSQLAGDRRIAAEDMVHFIGRLGFGGER